MKIMMAIMMTNVKMMTMMMDDEYCNLWRCSAGRVSTGSANGGWDTIHHPPSSIQPPLPSDKDDDGDDDDTNDDDLEDDENDNADEGL